MTLAELSQGRLCLPFRRRSVRCGCCTLAVDRTPSLGVSRLTFGLHHRWGLWAGIPPCQFARPELNRAAGLPDVSRIGSLSGRWWFQRDTLASVRSFFVLAGRLDFSSPPFRRLSNYLPPSSASLPGVGFNGFGSTSPPPSLFRFQRTLGLRPSNLILFSDPILAPPYIM